MNDPTPKAAPKGIRALTHFTKLLVPTDFSPEAQRAFAYALALARQHDAEVHLLHVIAPLEGDVYSPLRFTPEASVRQKSPTTMIYEHLQSVVNAQDTEGLRIEVAKLHGRAAPTILQYAAREEVDLIVMGSRDRSGMQRFLWGSVSEYTVREAPCSVLTLHDHDDDSPPLIPAERILVPIDFSDFSWSQLQAAQMLALESGAQLDVLHVIEPLPFTGVLTGIMTANDLVPDLQNQTNRILSQIWDDVRTGDVTAKLHVEEGHAATRIVDFATRFGVDLIVIAPQGRSNVERFLLGSVAERVVRTAPCPVLTLRPLPTNPFEPTDHPEASWLSPSSSETTGPASSMTTPER